MFAKILITISSGFLVGLILNRYKVPGGMLIGAVLAGAFLTLNTNYGYMPAEAKTVAQIIAGAFIGCSIQREDMKKLKTIYKPAIVMFLALLILNIVLGFSLYWLGYMDLLTALMCCVPGGIADVTLIAADFGCDMSIVVLFHFSRATVGIALFPSLIAMICKDEIACSDPEGNSDESKYSTKESIKSLKKVDQTPWSLFLVFIVATFFGVIGRLLDVPAGTLLFAMIAGVFLKLRGLRIVFPRWIKKFAQILSGAYIGCMFTSDSIRNLSKMIVPVIVVILGFFVCAYVTARIMRKHFGFSLGEGMLTLTPAGASDMALISADLGVQSTNLVLLHVLRLILAVSVFPQICYFIAYLYLK